MTQIRKLYRSMNGGVITPEMFSRIDDTKVQNGVETANNFIILPHGPAANRAGTSFVKSVKTPARKTKLLPYTFSSDQTFVLEFGHQYIRFHTAGATVLVGTPAAWNSGTAFAVGDLTTSGGTVYYCILAHTNQTPPNATYWYAQPSDGTLEVPSTYDEADLFSIHYVQSNDILTLVHPNYKPRELRRYSATRWVLADISFASTLVAPTGVGAVATTGTGSTTYTYVVTSVSADGRDESPASSSASCTNNLLTTGNKNTVSWTAPAVPPAFYNVYLSQNGIYGFIGQTTGVSFVDDNIDADLSKTPPITNDPFNSSNNYPGAVTYFEQRRAFAGTNNGPQSLWLTRSGSETSLSYSLPSRDNDAVIFTIAARESSRIRHLVPLSDLIPLSSSVEYRIAAVGSDALTQSSVSAKPQSYIGASDVQPVVVNTSILFPAARGGHLREMSYDWRSNGFVTGDLCLRAPHLFDNLSIMDLAYAKAPQSIAWAVSSNGSLIGLTYVPDQQIGAFHTHTTLTLAGQSIIESVACVAEGQIDSVYLVVKRVINGATVRYIERLNSRFVDAVEDMVFVDCALSYSGTAVTTVSGLSHLEGETVNVLADGAVVNPLTVTSGSITLARAASKIQVGLPLVADLKTAPLYFEGEGGFGQGRNRNVHSVTARLFKSRGFKAGQDFNNLTEVKGRTTEPYGTVPALITGEAEIVIRNKWESDGSVCIRQDLPLPLTICGLVTEVAIGA